MKYNLLDDSCQSLRQFNCLLSKLQPKKANKFLFVHSIEKKLMSCAY